MTFVKDTNMSKKNVYLEDQIMRLTGQDAIDFLEQDSRPLTAEEIKDNERCVEVYKKYCEEPDD